MIEQPAELRILHITTTLDRGGAENHLYDLICGQLAKGDVKIACAFLKGDGYWRSAIEALGVQVFDLRMPSYGAVRPFFRFSQAVRQFGPNVVHAHGAPAEIYALVAKTSSRKRPRLIFTRHEPRIRLFQRPGYGMIDRLLARAVDGVIAVSKSVMATDIDRRPSLTAKSRVIHHGIDPTFASAVDDGAVSRLRAEWEVGAEGVLIGTIARHTSEKSLDTLLRAFAVVVAGMQTKLVRLAIVGRGPLTAELKELAGKLDIADSVIWCDQREDIPVVISALDIFVLTSREEGFGLVLLEAMACSTPIVASRVDAIPEVVEDGVTGFLCRPRDAGDFADKIGALVTDPSLRAAMGKEGFVRLKHQFTLQSMREKTAIAYDVALRSS